MSRIKFYVLAWFNTRDKKLESIGRATEAEVLDEIRKLIASIPHDPENEKFDFSYSEYNIIGANEHNAWVKEADGTEWVISSECWSFDPNVNINVTKGEEDGEGKN